MAKKIENAPKKRGRKPKQASETKVDKVEVRQVAAEVLKIAEPDTILHHMKTVRGYKDRVTTAQGHLRNAYKAAKAAGIPKTVLDDLFGLERGDANDFRHELETLKAGLEAVGAPFQLNVFDTAMGSDVEQAKLEARQAADAGRPPECRWAEGSDAHKAYHEQYQSTQAERVPGVTKLTPRERSEAVSEGLATAAE